MRTPAHGVIVPSPEAEVRPHAIFFDPEDFIPYDFNDAFDLQQFDLCLHHHSISGQTIYQPVFLRGLRVYEARIHAALYSGEGIWQEGGESIDIATTRLLLPSRPGRIYRRVALPRGCQIEAYPPETDLGIGGYSEGYAPERAQVYDSPHPAWRQTAWRQWREKMVPFILLPSSEDGPARRDAYSRIHRQRLSAVLRGGSARQRVTDVG